MTHACKSNFGWMSILCSFVSPISGLSVDQIESTSKEDQGPYLRQTPRLIRSRMTISGQRGAMPVTHVLDPN
jgi:hypothetical protein